MTPITAPDKMLEMDIAKRNPKQANRKPIAAARNPVAAASSTPVPSSLQKLYARPEKTKPGSPESKKIAEQIIDAIG
jgi:hypothetical protein